MGAAHSGEHGRDMAVLAVDGRGALGKIPGGRREPTLDRGDGPRPAACALGAGSERREIEADAFGVGDRSQVEALVGRPAQIVAPFGGVGAVGQLRLRPLHGAVQHAENDDRLWLIRRRLFVRFNAVDNEIGIAGDDEFPSVR